MYTQHNNNNKKIKKQRKTLHIGHTICEYFANSCMDKSKSVFTKLICPFNFGLHNLKLKVFDDHFLIVIKLSIYL
jgi:hypothetical protein